MRKFLILALLCPFLSMCQPLSLNGKLLNEQSEPIAGATIMIQRTGHGTTSTHTGEFTITNLQLNDTLIITAVGYEQHSEIFDEELARRPILNITLKRRSTALEEVIINTGYQSMSPAKATGAYTVITKEQLARRPGGSLLERMQDLAPGILFNKADNNLSGGITIRGRSTLYGNTEPLIVLDNFPYDGSLANINPSDVESITVLKDAAAAALWGARAGNGVIVITTKKGKTAKPRVEFSSNFSFVEKPALMSLPILPSADYIELEKFLFSKGYYNADLSHPSHPPVTPVVELLAAKAAGTINPSEADARIEAFKQVDARKEIADNLYRRGVIRQHNVSISGASPFLNYYLSLGADHEMPALLGTENTRLTAASRNTFKLHAKLDVVTSITLTQRTTASGNNPGFYVSNGGGKSLYPYARLRDEAGNPVSLLRDYRPSFLQSAQGAGLLNWEYNPIDDIGLTQNHFRITDQVLGGGVIYRPAKGLSVEGRYSYESSLSDGKNLSQQQSYYARNLVNQFTQVTQPNNVLTRPIPLGGIIRYTLDRLISHQGRGQVGYTRGWGKDHHLSTLAGAEVKELRGTSNGSTVYGYNEAGSTVNTAMDFVSRFTRYDNTSVTAQIPNPVQVKTTMDRFVSYYANAVYAYKNRYTLSLSARKDASNLFGVRTNQKGVPLWSAGVKWEIGNEKFYRVGALPRLAIRLTAGSQGNISRSTSALATASFTTSPTTGALAAEINNPPNQNLRWEKVTTYNAGIDFRAKNDRVAGTIDIYQKRATDLMGRAPIDGTLGLAANSGNSTFFGNVASIDGKGLDLQLDIRWATHKLQWGSTILFSAVQSKLTKYTMPVSALGSAYLSESLITPVLGNELFGIYSFPWAGLDGATGNPRGLFNGGLSTDYASIVGKTLLDSMVYTGSINPTVFGALRNNLQWKNFSLSFTLSYRLGYAFRRPTVNYVSLFSTWSGHADYHLRWQKPGDENQTEVPSLIYPANTNRDRFYANSEALVERADHLRWEDISLNYQWVAKGRSFLPFQSARLYLFLQDLGVVWRANRHRIDPNFLTTPRNGRTLSLGLAIQF